MYNLNLDQYYYEQAPTGYNISMKTLVIIFKKDHMTVTNIVTGNNGICVICFVIPMSINLTLDKQKLQNHVIVHVIIVTVVLKMKKEGEKGNGKYYFVSKDILPKEKYSSYHHIIYISLHACAL